MQLARPPKGIGWWAGLVGGLLFAAAATAALAISVAGYGLFGLAAPHSIGSDLKAAQRAIEQVACGFDPTDPCNWSVVVVMNDQQSQVSLLPCNNHGGKGDHCGPATVIAAGHRSPANQNDGFLISSGMRTWVAVVSQGRRLGCLVLYGRFSFDKQRQADLVRISEVEKCGDSNSPTTKPVGKIVL